MADAIEIQEYVDQEGHNPFRVWFQSLDRASVPPVSRKLLRLRDGNTSGVKSVGAGVYELKINFGPGYRVYFGYAGKTIVLLVGGGSKQRQQADIAAAKAVWLRYKQEQADGEP